MQNDKNQCVLMQFYVNTWSLLYSLKFQEGGLSSSKSAAILGSHGNHRQKSRVGWFFRTVGPIYSIVGMLILLSWNLLGL